MKKIQVLIVFLMLIYPYVVFKVFAGNTPPVGSDITTAFYDEPVGRIKIVAGGNGSGAAANQLRNANDVFVDAAGNIYVADRFNYRVQKWAPGAAAGVTVAGGNGFGPSGNQISSADGIFVDESGNVYVADGINNRVQKWAPGASFGIAVGFGLNGPYDVFVDVTGNIFVADGGNGRIQKFAPGATSGVTVAGGSGLGSAPNQLHFPNDVFVDDAGNIYVADTWNHRIQKWAPGATAGITVAGGNSAGSAANQLHFPNSVYVDKAGNMYISDDFNYRIQKWAPGASEGTTVRWSNNTGSGIMYLGRPDGVHVDATGSIYIAANEKFSVFKIEFPDETVAGSTANGITVAGGRGPGSAPNQLSSPSGVFVDVTGNIYVADRNNHRVQKWVPGALSGITVAGGNGPGAAANQLSASIGVSVDPAGNIYVADGNNHRIQKWAPGATQGITVAGGNGIGLAANQLFAPTGVFVDAAANIYVADYGNNRIQKWTPGASAGITVAGGNGYGSGANQLKNPEGVFVDANGNVYVADNWNDRIQKWAPGASEGITVAGGNGRGSAANQFNDPTGVFVDARGNIYVADYFNHRIQKWVPGALEGITVAGGNGWGSAADQLAFAFGIFVNTNGNLYVADGGNHRIQKFDNIDIEVATCPDNLKFTAPYCNEKATIYWIAPKDTFPAGIETPEALDPAKGKLTFMGAINGHGYYRSTGKLLWQSARDLSKAIGVSGHLATVSSPEETNLIFNQIKNSGYSPWIGLSNTGRPGRFRWVNGEPLTYTNWAPGEPNNFGGSNRNITEPYVRMIDTSGAWNDQRDDYLPFIVEFEKPLIRYRQISGPRNRSTQKPGVYTVCYERRDFTTDKRDTCCFTITVTCNPAIITQNTGIDSDNIPASEKVTTGLQVTTSPNPSSFTFRLNIVSDNNEKISLQVTDALGRVVETRNGLTPNQPLLIGSSYRPGIYFAKVIMGSKTTTVRLIKKPDNPY